MKKLITFSILLSSLAVFNSCSKEGGNIPQLTQVPVVVLTADATSDNFISPVSPATFKSKFVVDLLFADDARPQNVDIVVMKNNNTGNVKVVKAGVTLPSTVEVTGQQLISLFGAIEGGDQFNIGTDITLINGEKLLAFPALGNAVASGVTTEIGNVKPGAVSVLQYLMPCAFDATEYQGDFEVVSDEWHDYDPGTVITVTMINETQISFKYNVSAGTAQPIIMTIDPATNAITVTRQYYGSYGAFEVYAESIPGAASTVNPCDLSLSVRLKHTDPNGALYDNSTIVLRKK